jgi:hypothetical protein
VSVAIYRAELQLVLPPPMGQARSGTALGNMSRALNYAKRGAGSSCCLLTIANQGEIWVGGADGLLRVYDCASGALRRAWAAHNGGVAGACADRPLRPPRNRPQPQPTCDHHLTVSIRRGCGVWRPPAVADISSLTYHIGGLCSTGLHLVGPRPDGGHGAMVCSISGSVHSGHVRLWPAALDAQAHRALASSSASGNVGASGSSAPAAAALSRRRLGFSFYYQPPQLLPPGLPLWSDFLLVQGPLLSAEQQQQQGEDAGAAAEASSSQSSAAAAGGGGGGIDYQGGSGAAPRVLLHRAASAGPGGRALPLDADAAAAGGGGAGGALASLADFCVPSGCTGQPFGFLLSPSADGGTPITLYCTCYFVDAPRRRCCMCLVSRHPYFAMHFEVLRRIALVEACAHMSGGNTGPCNCIAKDCAGLACRGNMSPSNW